MQEQREELLRLAREVGLPVEDGASITDIVRLLNGTPDFARDLVEALDAILAPAPCTGK